MLDPDQVDLGGLTHALQDHSEWRHTLRSGTVVSALPESSQDMDSPGRPVLTRTVAEGITVA